MDSDAMITVHLRCHLDDGTEVASSDSRPPVRFAAGTGEVLPAFAEAAARLNAPGESVHIRLEVDEAYGSRRDELMFVLDAAPLPRGLEVGQHVRLGYAPAVVTAVDEGTVTVDANHPLAGQALSFEIERAVHEPSRFDPYGYVAGAPWRFAKTMALIPHWYTVRGQTPDDHFESFVRYIRADGYRGRYRGPFNKGKPSHNTYLRIGGWKYWTMGAPVEDTTVINRALAMPEPPWRAPALRPDPLTAEEVVEE